MKISSLETSFLDYPDRTSLLVFMTGCEFGCKNCQNPQLQDGRNGTDINNAFLLKELKKRPLCTAITFTGGDPLYQYSELLEACKAVFGVVKVGVYTGSKFEDVPKELFQYINFLKTEPYIEALGGVSSDTTNQKCWDVVNGEPILNMDYFKSKQ